MDMIHKTAIKPHKIPLCVEYIFNLYDSILTFVFIPYILLLFFLHVLISVLFSLCFLRVFFDL